MVTETLLEAAGAELATRIRGRRYGTIHVYDATADVITDVNGYLAVELHLRLNDPDGETWPPDDTADLRRDIWTESKTFGEPFMVYEVLWPTTEAKPHPDDRD